MVSKSIAIVRCGVYNKCVYTLYIMCCCVLFLCYGVMALHFRENKSMVFDFWMLYCCKLFVGCFRGWMWIFCGVFAILFQFGSSVISRPLAAVGADLSRPHIRKCPQNGEQKCVCGDLNIRILRCGHPFAMKWIYVFNNGKIRIWQCKDTGTMNRPLRLAVCKLGVFVSVCWEFRGWT